MSAAPERGEHEIKVGFAGDQKTIKVKSDDRDLRPWDLDSKLTVIGSDTPRVDAVQKVTGIAKYAYDVKLPGMLFGAILRSKHARGKLASVDLTQAQKQPGVAAAIALKQPGNKLRYVGDEIAAVAATSLDLAYDALETIKVEYEVEAHVVDFLKAPDAPSLDGEGRVITPWPEGADAVATALQGSKETIEATYRCEVQTHSSLETHGAVAFWDGDVLEVWASTQGTFGMRDALARAMEVPANRVRVHAEYVGGGFGSKLGSGVEYLAAARLAREAKAPVKLMLDRFEEHTCTGNRPGALMRIRAGATAEGAITAFEMQSWGAPGFTGSGRATSPGHYFATAKKRDRPAHKDLLTDTDAGRPMRAPGYPQGFFATELALDELAARLALDPLALRLKNDSHTLRHHEWRLGAERFEWTRRRNPKPGTPMAGDDPRFLRGAGLSSAVWGGTGNPGSRALCRIHRDGTVEARNGAQDIGTGMKTVMALVTAEELQIPPGRVRVTMGDTQDPVGPGSGGSTTTPSLAPAVRHAAGLAKRKLIDKVAEHLQAPADQIVHQDGKLGVAGGRMLGWDDACKLLGAEPIEAIGERFPNLQGYQNHVCGCQFAEVLVDTWTGLVRATRMLAVQDCGTLIDKKLAESQVLGAMIQGISYALHEQRILDQVTGRMVNGDFSWYKIAGSEDVPPLEAIMVPVLNGHTNVGAMGLGEAPATAPAAAIANAVFNAIGVPVRWLPITPGKVMAALAARKEAR